MSDKHETQTAAEEVLRELKDAETRLGDEESGKHDREAADALSTSAEAQEHVQKGQNSRSGH
jgi:hypothetical protein